MERYKKLYKKSSSAEGNRSLSVSLGTVLVRASVAVINTTTISSMRRKGLFGLCFHKTTP